MVFVFVMLPGTSAQPENITVLNPRGTPPPIQLIPMAPRPTSLQGKTIYFIDIGYEGGASLLREIMAWFEKYMPAAELIFKEKEGAFNEEDEKLLAEIKQKGEAAVVAVGH